MTCIVEFLCCFIISCNTISYKEKVAKDNINKEVQIDCVDSVYQGENKYSFKQIRSEYDFVSIICLQLGCHSCHSQYEKWNELFKEENCVVLFVVVGANINEFKKEFSNYAKIKPFAYIYPDNISELVTRNMLIPWSVFSSTILIDKSNSIKIIGSPFNSQKNAKLYHNICVRK